MSVSNPYVGPRTFQSAERHLFFGREKEAIDLARLAAIEQVVILYGNSGVGKSSLINARLIPVLQNEGFHVLPIGRVAGERPVSVSQTDNLFLLNLKLRLDQSNRDPNRLVRLSLSNFLAHLTCPDGYCWFYDETISSPGEVYPTVINGVNFKPQPFLLIIDQFEEIFSNIAHWQDRKEFFIQLGQALKEYPLLSVVLCLREDYLAQLDPYIQFVPGRLRTRYRLEGMNPIAALDAIRRPAELYGLPFALGIAEMLIDNLRLVKASGQAEAQLGQYVEPVQLQIVCYRLWEEITASSNDGSAEITMADLQQMGDIDAVLAEFYEQTLKVCLTLSAAISERQLRAWFDEQLITVSGTRRMVHQGLVDTAGMPNNIVHLLVSQFLLRTEMFAGDQWVELIHDRFVEPIQQANRAWSERNSHPIAQAVQAWLASERQPTFLYRDGQLADAISQLENYPSQFGEAEREFIRASQQAESQRKARRQRLVTLGSSVLILVLVALTGWALWNAQQASNSATKAQEAATTAAYPRSTADANAALAAQQLARLAGLRLFQEAEQLKIQGKMEEALDTYFQASESDKSLNIDLDFQKEDVLRQAAILLVSEGEQLARNGNLADAIAKYQSALNLNPPLDTPLYVPVTAGSVTIGSTDKQIDAAYRICEEEHPTCEYNWFQIERPQTTLEISEFWILRTEVTNWQYAECVHAKICEAPANRIWHKSESRNLPVTYVSWYQAEVYAHWKGGRLPTEAEWEKACRGDDKRSYPWGNEKPTLTLVNWAYKEVTVMSVGSYPEGRSPYGLLDMAGNVWEWTNSQLKDYPYQMADGREGKTEGGVRVLRGGAFSVYSDGIRCPSRMGRDADKPIVNVGFRIISPGF